MKAALSVLLALTALLFCANAQAQFSQPPPTTTPPPVCSLQKSSARCKRDPAGLIESGIVTWCWAENDLFYCQVDTVWFDGTTWITLDPSLIEHHWAFIVDGQEYYLNPTPMNTLTIGCGYSREGHVRITVLSHTWTMPITCPASP
jgi:hypothetical protein